MRPPIRRCAFLARVYAATGEGKYKEGFLKGVGYLLKAQYPNGGWRSSIPYWVVITIWLPSMTMP